MGQTITILGVFLSLFGKLLDLKKDYTDLNSFNLEAKVAAKWKIHSVFLNNVITWSEQHMHVYVDLDLDREWQCCAEFASIKTT